jgi:hypothetical protein
VPKLDGFSLKEIGKATGLSLATCSRIRAGAKVPHARHWGALLALIERQSKPAAWLLRWDPRHSRRSDTKPRDARGARSMYQ